MRADAEALGAVHAGADDAGAVSHPTTSAEALDAMGADADDAGAVTHAHGDFRMGSLFGCDTTGCTCSPVSSRS